MEPILVHARLIPNRAGIVVGVLSRSRVGGPVAIIREDWGIPASPILICTIDIDKPLGSCQWTWSSSACAATRAADMPEWLAETVKVYIH
jgi:hypothetical protein